MTGRELIGGRAIDQSSTTGGIDIHHPIRAAHQTDADFLSKLLHQFVALIEQAVRRPSGSGGLRRDCSVQLRDLLGQCIDLLNHSSGLSSDAAEARRDLAADRAESGRERLRLTEKHLAVRCARRILGNLVRRRKKAVERRSEAAGATRGDGKDRREILRVILYDLRRLVGRTGLHPLLKQELAECALDRGYVGSRPRTAGSPRQFGLIDRLYIVTGCIHVGRVVGDGL